MGAGDDSSFFLYGMGERPEALTLGSLVLEKYWQPMIARHYTHKLMSEDALREHVHTTDLTNVVFHGCSRLTPSAGVEGFDVVNLNLAYSKDLERFVVAEKGSRMILKDPETFLANQVMKNPLAQEKLKLWLSAAYSAYIFNFKFARRPKVWLLTGLYLLKGARTAVSRAGSAKVSAGISSTIVGALSGVPIGGSVSLDAGSLWDMAMEVAEPHVWAAQFRLLDARFIKMGKQGMDGVKLPLSMGLYRDVMSVHTARGGEGNSVEIGLEGQEVSVESGMEIDHESEEVEEYEKQLEQAIKIFESSPRHFLQ